MTILLLAVVIECPGLYLLAAYHGWRGPAWALGVQGVIVAAAIVANGGV